MAAPLYAWLGDDFTGSTAVLEALAEGGVPAVLFLRPPTPELLASFGDARAIGLASDARSRDPAWMDAHLPGLLAAVGRDAPVLHYKTCSTFDSAPGRGSIGRALEIGRGLRGGPVPVLVGTPGLARYVVFGTLFAAAGDGAIHRIDRHPTMAHHPATPMREADLRRHLAAQTAMPLALIDLPTLHAGAGPAAFAAADPAGAVLFDGVDAASLAAAGAILWAEAQRRPLFATGSQGLTEALLAAWRAEGVASGTASAVTAGPVERLLVVSGSCSPVTSAQIGAALEAGYAGVALAPDQLAGDAARVIDAAVAALAAGRSCILYTARGPLGGAEAAGDALGGALGRMIRMIVERTGIARVLLAGGDTSSHAVAELGLDALTWAGRLQRGAPLCRAHGTGALDGLELVLKGGQIGTPDFFERVRLGTG